MKEQFVTPEIALALKEIGFDEPTLGFFEPKNNKLIIDPTHIVNNSGYGVVAPLWQQTIDFIREQHKLIVEVRVEMRRNYNNWYFEIYKQELPNHSPDCIFSYDWNYDTFYIAREEAILKAIELIKNKENE